MNSLLLVVLVSGQPVAVSPDAAYPVAVSPDAGAAHGGSSRQGGPRLFGWLRDHHHDKKNPYTGNGPAGGGWSPVTVAPAVEAGAAEAVTVQPAPAVVPPPACHCAGNGPAGGGWPPAAAAPAPTAVPPPATAGPAPRLVPSPQPATTSAEPPLAAPPADASRLR